MFGTRLRTWMETHIVRSRKKLIRKDDRKTGSCDKYADGSTSGHIESHSFERQYGKRSPRKNSQDVLPEVLPPVIGLPSEASMSFKRSHQKGHCAVNNLSSPESAYSTGYSTDGTSPGASVPPEYYINIRTGTHYFHAAGAPGGEMGAGAVAGGARGDAGPAAADAVPSGAPSPLPAGRHRRDDSKKKARQNGGCQGEGPLPESSTEEDVAERLGRNVPSGAPPSMPKVKCRLLHPMYNGLHRRTESCDETKRTSSLESQDRGSGSDSTGFALAAANGAASLQCASPYLPGASPRQRNRIRTNPWLSTQSGAKSYNSQGETSSTVGSSSTLSSSGQGQGGQATEKEKEKPAARACASPRTKERRRTARNVPPVLSPPMSNGVRRAAAVTTCSPLPSRPCAHAHAAGLRSSKSGLRTPPHSSSESTAPSSASDDEHHGNTSDFSDDDVTLNEMLGKYDESYTYEKETDILSDSDPTDCEDREISEDRESGGHLPISEIHEQLDFIDQGSLVELANSDSDSYNKRRLAGHCTYHHLPGQTPEAVRKLTPRLRESLARRQSRQPRKTAKSRDSPLSDRRFRTYRKTSARGPDISGSCEAFPKAQSPLPQRLVEARHPGESPAKYMNLNRMLMERIMSNQRNGTRSADGTPVSLRRRGHSKCDGKYARNHNVTNLIDSDLNFNERRPGDPFADKPCSGYSLAHADQTKRTPAPSGLNDLDKEGDLKYRQLIQEAEHIIEDLQVKSASKSDYLSPTFRCKNGMERAKPSSPLVFSVPPSPLSLRYDVYRDGYETPPTEHEPSNNNLSFGRLSYANRLILENHKDKIEDSEEGLLKSISKTLERIIVRGTSDTNKKLDKSVSDPFAKGKKRFVLPAPPIYANGTVQTEHGLENITPIRYATPNPLRRSGSGSSNSSIKISSCHRSVSKLNQNDISNQGGFKKFFKKQDKSTNPSIEQLDKHDFPDNGFRITVPEAKPEGIYENREVYKDMAKNDVHNAKYAETRTSFNDYSPNGNTPIYANGFQQIPWQHRTSQAERLKNLSDLRDSPQRKTNSPDINFDNKPPLASFSSFDLGNKHVASSKYCPQSEPVKRKIYKCSATFGKLQKSLLRKHPGVQSSKVIPETEYKESSYSNLKLQVAQLRRETQFADTQVFDTQGLGDGQILTKNIIGTG